MIQNLIFGILFFLKILFRFRAYNFLYLLLFLVKIIRFFWFFWFFFLFSSRKPQSQQKLAKKDTHFTIQFHSKNLTQFKNLNSLDIENNVLATQSKTFLTLQIFQPTFFCLVLEKTFALYHFLTPENCILEAVWKQMSVDFCIFL